MVRGYRDKRFRTGILLQIAANAALFDERNLSPQILVCVEDISRASIAGA
jgi:hypothetical protein